MRETPERFLDLLHRVVQRVHLTRAQAKAAIGALVTEGATTQAQVGALLTAWRMKGETADELAGAVDALRERMVTLPRPEGRIVVDTCGTGGDGQHTFNISTAAALVAASAGLAVAKHGNRAVSSRAGSADVLQALGVHIEAEPERLSACLQTHGFAFLFAPRFHPAMRLVASARRELGLRTLFNLVGPLVNPVGADAQVIGVFDAGYLDLMADVAHCVGLRRALIVHARDGQDELSPCAPTDAVLVTGDEKRRLVLTPEDAGLARAPMGSITGGDAKENARIIEGVFAGARDASREAVLLNAGAALWMSGAEPDLRAGVARATLAVDEGAAARTLLNVKRALSAAPTHDAENR